MGVKRTLKVREAYALLTGQCLHQEEAHIVPIPHLTLEPKHAS